jgi:hypothetical protein
MDLTDGDCDDLRAILDGRGTNIRYTQLARWLRRADFSEHGGGGSHRAWRHPSGKRFPAMVDHGRGHILPVYAKRAARAIVDLGGCP